MISSKKRGRFEIYGDILEAIEDESHWAEGAHLTRVQSKSNLAYDRFRKDLARLQEKGFVRLTPPEGDGIQVTVTDAGKEYLEHYRGAKKFLATYGL